MPSLFDALQMGDIALSNRVVMAPLTRNRSPGPGRMPGPLTAEYYRQRASAGLLITEATHISPTAQGYVDTPGIYTDEQEAAWQRVTQAVHAEGGRIVVQLWHVGRISHVSLLPPGEVPVSSTARASGSRTQVAGPDGSIVLADCSTPRPLRIDEMPAVVDSYRASARRAIDAAFDYAAMRAAFGGPWMVNNGYTRPMALDAVASGRADLVAFGRPFISNPDLVRRLRDDAPWAESHRATYYGGGAEGYTDYPALAAQD